MMLLRWDERNSKSNTPLNRLRRFDRCIEWLAPFINKLKDLLIESTQSHNYSFYIVCFAQRDGTDKDLKPNHCKSSFGIKRDVEKMLEQRFLQLASPVVDEAFKLDSV